MKKIFLTLFAASMLILTSCGGSTTKTETTEPTGTEAAATETPAAGSDFLTKYEEFVNKAIPLYEKASKGDAAAMQELATAGSDLAKFMQDNQEAISKLSEADTKKYQELAQKLVDAATPK